VRERETVGLRVGVGHGGNDSGVEVAGDGGAGGMVQRPAAYST
jgi:hypothetical protein